MEANCRVLIVDDEVLVRQGIKHLLNWEREGFLIVGEASNGQEAMQMIEQLKPHIVVTDIVMPIMDGVELTSLIKEQYSHIEVIVLSSFSEFHYVRDTFQKGVADYLLKPKLDAEQLLSILKRTVKNIPSLQSVTEAEVKSPNVSMQLERLLSGYSMDAGMNFQYSSFRLYGADLKHIKGQAISKEQVLQRMEEVLAPFMNTLHYFVVPTDANYAVLLLNSSERDWESIMPAIRALSNSTRMKEHAVCWILGDRFTELADLSIQYHEHFMRLASYRYFLPVDRSFIVRHELPKQSAEEPAFDMNLFMELLQRRKFDEAISQLQQYASAALNHYTIDVFAFKSQLGNAIFNMLIMLSKLDITVKHLEQKKYEYIRTINESNHVSEAMKELNICIGHIQEAIAVSRVAASNPNMSLILDYIHQHYMEPISLSDVANHFHFNATYLSTFFSTHNAEGFSEYLNRVRTEKAAELLTHTDMAISDISVQVGYSDHSYFTKVFKKLKGKSPSHYRRSSVSK